MLAVIGILLIIWLGITLIGVLFKAVFWLAIIGGVAFIGTAAYGAIKNKSRT